MDFLIICKKTQQELKKLENYSSEFQKCAIAKQNSVLTHEEEKKQDKKIDSIIDEFSHLCDKIKRQIETSTKETQKLKEKNTNSYVIKMREDHIFGHTKKLTSIIKHFQQVQHSIKKREKEKLKETYIIACPDATEEELKDFENLENAETMLEAAFAVGSNSSKTILKQAMGRKHKINQIVSKIAKLVELIDEIDKITVENSDKIDKIVISMENAKENTENAVENLETARDYQEGANYIKRMLFYGALILFSGLVLFVVLFISRNKPEN
ncbi:syx-3 [Ecytonucleospora hepatopenaei]|uniref:Syx-3 n=1 Tax=Ecytonucleospora hepatopenaei TaxID=646526 RepID=A0A1W0E6D6_9MICR|nr:syx-3 [Ecytonucleospora hepatopenaei]